MADTGKIVVEGFGAGAIEYVVLEGFNPNPVALAANVVDMGFGTPGGRLVLEGFWPNAGAETSGAFYVFGEEVLG